MGKRIEPAGREAGAQQREEYAVGLQCIRNHDYEGALMFFSALDESADFDDQYHNRYASFHGLSRVLTGDVSGIKLCRKAAVGNDSDVEVFYNLALAEHRLQNRESAYLALRRGLRIDPQHRGLIRLKQEVGLREQHRFVPWLARNGWLNRWLGRLLRGLRRPRDE